MLFLLLACSGGADTAAKGDATAGETVFSSTCAACHGADGTGGSGPDITGEANASDLADIIKNGEGDMPPQDLTDTEIADVIAYMQATF
jgi:cytochrome c551